MGRAAALETEAVSTSAFRSGAGVQQPSKIGGILAPVDTRLVPTLSTTSGLTSAMIARAVNNSMEEVSGLLDLA